jgi:type II secretory pathway component GspD/PulD (secretin)
MEFGINRRFVVAIALALAAIAAPLTAVAADNPSLVTLHADNAPVIEILDLLAARSGLNIVAGAEVQGRAITLHLKDTPFDEALALVARASGLAYERVGNSILVADSDRLASGGVQDSRVFELSWARADEVRGALDAISSSIRADVRGNRVIVRGSAAALAEAGRVVKALDVKPIQVLLEARLIEVNTTKLLEVGIDWTKLSKWSSVFTEGKPDPTSLGKMPEAVEFIKVGERGQMYRQSMAWEAAVEALLTNGHGKLLANSKIVTLDGEAAEIFAGQTVPVVITSLQGQSGGGALQTVQLEKIDVGVRLNITPRVGDDGLITTLVKPEVSSIVGFVGPDNDLPQTATRRASSLVRVRDGEKIYMGGLLSEETHKTVKRVPLLGSIPLIGVLFQHTRDDVQRTDLVIEITPHIVGDSGQMVPTGSELHPDVDLGGADQPKVEEVPAPTPAQAGGN